jgi:hypothetical protein
MAPRQIAPWSSRKVIYAAIAGNLLVAASKVGAAAWTGNSAMWSEGSHRDAERRFRFYPGPCRRSSASPRTRSWSSSTRTISRYSRLCNRAWAHVTPTWPEPMTEMRGRWETMRKPRIRRRHRAGSDSTQPALYMRGGSRRARASDARLIPIAQDLNGG